MQDRVPAAGTPRVVPGPVFALRFIASGVGASYSVDGSDPIPIVALGVERAPAGRPWGNVVLNPGISNDLFFEVTSNADDSVGANGRQLQHPAELLYSFTGDSTLTTFASQTGFDVSSFRHIRAECLVPRPVGGSTPQLTFILIDMLGINPSAALSQSIVVNPLLPSPGGLIEWGEAVASPPPTGSQAYAVLQYRPRRVNLGWSWSGSPTSAPNTIILLWGLY